METYAPSSRRPYTHVRNGAISEHNVVKVGPRVAIGPRRCPAEARRFLQWQKERRKRADCHESV